MQGRFIVFEGGEGSGKTTQLARLSQWVRNSGWLELLKSKGFIQHVVTTREPGGTEIGQNIRQLLLTQTSQETIEDGTELLLYAADRRQHVAGYLRPQLAQGALILCDRFTDSTIAYQGYGRGLDMNLIHQLNQIATNGLQSDLTLWLDIDPEIGLTRTMRRGSSDRIEQADLAFHQRVHQGFSELTRQYPERIVRIDGSQSEDLVTQQIQIAVSQAFQQWFAITLDAE